MTDAKPVGWLSEYALEVIKTGHSAMHTISASETRIHCNPLYSAEAHEAVKRERDKAQAEAKRLREMLLLGREWLPSVEPHIYDSEAFKADLAKIDAAITKLKEQTDAGK